jgi:hypothetical protein
MMTKTGLSTISQQKILSEKSKFLNKILTFAAELSNLYLWFKLR